MVLHSAVNTTFEVLCSAFMVITTQLKAGTHYPYVRAVRTAVRTARTYGRVFAPVRTGRFNGPYVRVVCTNTGTYGPYGKKHCMQCFFARTGTGGVYGTPVHVARTPNVIGYPFH